MTTTKPNAAKCRWFLGCTNPATTTRPHPILGAVPCCARCKGHMAPPACFAAECEEEGRYTCDSCGQRFCGEHGQRGGDYVVRETPMAYPSICDDCRD